jgi:hypothetical protein
LNHKLIRIGVLSLFKWLVFNNSSGSFTDFLFFGLGGREGWTLWRLDDPAVRLPGFRSRMVPNPAGRRPRRSGIHFQISLATECRLSYPGPFVKRKTRAVLHWAAAPPSYRQLLWGELPVDGRGQVPTRRHSQVIASRCGNFPDGDFKTYQAGSLKRHGTAGVA